MRAIVLVVCAAAVAPAAAQSITFFRTYEYVHSGIAYDVAQMPDGGYVVVGATDTSPFHADAMIVRVDEYGDTLWTKLMGGWLDDGATRVLPLADGGFVFGGDNTDSWGEPPNGWLVRLSASGGSVWERFLGGSILGGITRTDGGGYAISGHGGDDVACYAALSLADSQGNYVSGGVCTFVYPTVIRTCGVVRQSDSVYAIAGDISYDFGSKYDGLLLWMSSSGDLLGMVSFGSPDSNDVLSWMVSLPNADLLLVGTSRSYGQGGSDVWLERRGPDGQGGGMWTYGTAGDDRGACVQVTSDGGFIIAGQVDPPGANEPIAAYLVKTDSLGTVEWERAYECWGECGASSVRQSSDGGYIIAGTAGLAYGGRRFFLLKTDEDGLVAVPEDHPVALPTTISVAAVPNPFNTSTTVRFDLPISARVRIDVLDVLGRVVAVLADEPMSPGNHSVRWDGSGCASGTYFARVSADGVTGCAKMILVK